MKKNEDSLRDLQENFKGINICIIRVPERGWREIGPEKLLKEILAKKILLNMGKEAVTQVQESQSATYDKFKEECTQTHVNQIDKN